jgi:hypothetical protein
VLGIIGSADAASAGPIAAERTARAKPARGGPQILPGADAENSPSSLATAMRLSVAEIAALTPETREILRDLEIPDGPPRETPDKP